MILIFKKKQKEWLRLRLPWDKSYLKIVFHVIVGMLAFYVLKLLIDFLVFTFKNFGDAFSDMGDSVGKILSVFSPVVLAFAIAYVFDPVIDFLQNMFDKATVKKKHKISHKRTAGTVMAYLVFLVGLVLAASFAAVQIGENSNWLMATVDSVNEFSSNYTEIHRNIVILLTSWGIPDFITDYVLTLAGHFSDFLNTVSDNFVSVIGKIGNGIATVLIALVIAFYFMKDKAQIKQGADKVSKRLFSKKANRLIRNTLEDIHAVFSGYIRGTLLDALIIGTLLSIGLSLVGVKFAVLIGVISGLAGFIPYFGSIMGFLLAVLVALFSGEPITALYAAIVVIVLQQIDSIYIVPKIVGESVELSPVMVIISLSVAGNLFGFVGMIFAVPICAVLKIFVVRFINRRAKGS